MRRRLSLAGQLLLLQLCIVLLVVVTVAAVSLAEADAEFRRDEGRHLRSVAENLAASSTVREGIDNQRWSDALAAVAESARAVSGASAVLIVDAAGILLTGPDAGRPAELGASTVRSGRSWIGVVDDGTTMLVAHVPVLHESGGHVIGFVVAGAIYPTVLEHFATASADLLAYLLVGGALGVIGSLLLARRVKRQTLGLEPREIAGLVEQREAMLHGIKEGVIGTDPADRVTLINDEGARLLGLTPDAVGRSLVSLRLEAALLDALTGTVAVTDQVVLRGDRVLVLNRMPVTVRGRPVGSVTTLRDRTELTTLRNELDVSRNATDALRAQAHEFANRMHTVAGLVQLEQYDEVVRYISQASQIQQNLTREVTSRIGDPSVAALLIAKASLAAEQRVQLRISSDSALPPVDEALATDLVTVVGNLVDNALDALDDGGWVEVSARTDGDDLIIAVRDSGAGVAPELAQEVFRQGFTTKTTGTHHGLGLALSRLVCTRRGGSVQVSGSVFTARVPYRGASVAATDPAEVRDGKERV